ncbi:unnamed protein product [Calicophoron daubneyi]|uniref:Phosducin domain-containing protein n=1 Tax=Calicophoron daubneyi TaxID=300641 RepID=A0AAV2TFC8_CALDB
MQSAEVDTEFNDILRQHGILPPKKTETVEEPPSPPADPEAELKSLSIQQLNAKLESAEDQNAEDEDVRFLEEYRRKRLAAMQEEAARARFGSVMQVTKADWKDEVTDAGDVYVVIHIGREGHPECNLIDSYLRVLARRFPYVKFMRGESCLCIPNYPETNLPSMLIYHEGQLVDQMIGIDALGGKSVTAEGLEWRLAQIGVLKSDLTEDPSKSRKEVFVLNGDVNRVGFRRRNSSHSSDSDS